MFDVIFQQHGIPPNGAHPRRYYPHTNSQTHSRTSPSAMPVFQTPYQRCPLDLSHGSVGSFYHARRTSIEARLAAIACAAPRELAAMVVEAWQAHEGVECVGLWWPALKPKDKVVDDSVYDSVYDSVEPRSSEAQGNGGPQMLRVLQAVAVCCGGPWLATMFRGVWFGACG